MIWLGFWVFIYAAKLLLRRQMLTVSVFTSFAGFLEPLFVPRYWLPPTLFDLARQTGFDLESFIFAFAVGGIGSVLYEAVLNAEHQRMNAKRIQKEKRWLHFISLASVPLIFAALTLFSELNPIYALAIALFAGGVAALLCRPDLAWNTFIGGSVVCRIVFYAFLDHHTDISHFHRFMEFTSAIWTIDRGMPLEELMFAYTFGMFWSGVYEHAMRYELKEPEPQS